MTRRERRWRRSSWRLQFVPGRSETAALRGGRNAELFTYSVLVTWAAREEAEEDAGVRVAGARGRVDPQAPSPPLLGGRSIAGGVRTWRRAASTAATEPARRGRPSTRGSSRTERARRRSVLRASICTGRIGTAGARVDGGGNFRPRGREKERRGEGDFAGCFTKKSFPFPLFTFRSIAARFRVLRVIFLFFRGAFFASRSRTRSGDVGSTTDGADRVTVFHCS